MDNSNAFVVLGVFETVQDGFGGQAVTQMMVNAELRRNTTLRQIESRRATFGQRMRDAVEQVDEMARATIAHQPHDEKRAA